MSKLTEWTDEDLWNDLQYAVDQSGGDGLDEATELHRRYDMMKERLSDLLDWFDSGKDATQLEGTAKGTGPKTLHEVFKEELERERGNDGSDRGRY